MMGLSANVRTVILLLVTSMLAACGPTGYQKNTMWDGLGYIDEEIEPGVYKIRYEVNANTLPETAERYWHRRATELCGHSDYAYDMHLSFESNTNYGGAGASTYVSHHAFPYAEGTANCNEAN